MASLGYPDYNTDITWSKFFDPGVFHTLSTIVLRVQVFVTRQKGGVPKKISSVLAPGRPSELKK